MQTGVPANVIQVWTSIGSLALGRCVRSRMQNGVRVYHRGDIEASLAQNARGESGQFTAHGDKVEDAAGQTWRTFAWVRRNMEAACSRSSLQRWHKGSVKALAGTRLEAQKIPLRTNGQWRWVWVYREDQLRAIGVARTSSSGQHGRVGWTYSECQQKGFGRDTLGRWSRRNGKGIPELGGQVLETWSETRTSPHRHMTRYRVFSARQLQAVLDVRLANTSAATERTTLADREALNEFGDVIRAGDLAQWRRHCQVLGRKLSARKVKTRWATPGDEGEWRNSRADLEHIADTLRKSSLGNGVYRDPKTKREYVTMRGFMALADLPEQGISPYRRRPHTALGRPIDCIQVTGEQLYVRRNRHGTITLLAKDDAEAIKDWRTGRERFLRLLLRRGPTKVTDIFRLGEKLGFKEDGLRAAARNIGIHRKRIGMRGQIVWMLGEGSTRRVQVNPQLPDGFGPKRPVSRPGRPRDPAVSALYEFCYQKLIVEKRSASNAMRMANERFGREDHDVVNEPSTVNLYARRHQKRIAPS